MAKGDHRRPRSSKVSKEQYDESFEHIFGRKEIKTWDPSREAESPDDVHNADPVREAGQGTGQGARAPNTGGSDK
jgi:hypothetical protein